MENTKVAASSVAEAKQNIILDMAAQQIGAIIWNNDTAGFHFIPEVMLSDENGDPVTVKITGLYAYKNTLYLIRQGNPKAKISLFYTPGVDVSPTVVTLDENKAVKALGDPANAKGFTTEGTTEEWLAIADCYFEALAED